MTDEEYLLELETVNFTEENEKFNIVVPANVSYKNDVCYIRYSLYIDSMPTKELIKITPDNAVTIIRSQNNIKNKFEYRQNYLYPMLYKTQNGIIDIEIKTQNLKIHRRSDEMKVFIRYDIIFASDVASTIELKIKLTERKK